MESSIAPVVGITLGDPAGIGPEIILRALHRSNICNRVKPLLIGDRRILDRAARIAGLHNLEIESVVRPEMAQFRPGTITMVDTNNADPNSISLGELSALGGRASVECVKLACEFALEKTIDAVVNGPVNKEALTLAGYRYAGQTEIYAERTNTKPSMVLIGAGMRIIHISAHVSLTEAIRRVDKQRVFETIQRANDICMDLGIERPRIGVAGLNPHAGEGGCLGDQEILEIAPAIEAARKLGMDVSSPIAPDVVFRQMRTDHFDIVVAMYHDQGHIPMNLLALESAVSVTVGLPFVRVTTIHGTAFHRAKTGSANESSMLACIELAAQLGSRASKVSG